MPIAMTADAARTFLRERGHDASDLTPLSGGLWSTTFAFRETGRDYVVRFHERRDDLEKDRFAERWRSPSLRIPHMTEIGDVPEGGGYGIAERVRGTPIDDASADEMRGLLPAVFSAIEAMRDADLSGTSGWGLWHGDGNGEHISWPDALMRDARSHQREIVARSPIGVREFDAGVARIGELLRFGPSRRHLVHDDLLNYNLLADERGIVVLDWGASTYGDFLHDAALLTFWWPWYGKWPSIDIDAEVARRFGDTPDFPARLRVCQVEIGVSHIAFQVGRGMLDAARWTARRTAELAAAAL